MTADITIDQNATAPIQWVKNYQGGIGAPPTLEGVFKSLLPVAKRTSTSPVQIGATSTYMILHADGAPLIVLPRQQTAAEQHAVAQSTLETIESLRSSLSLSVTQIAELFGVTRKSVYDWFEGAIPRAGVITKIQALHSIIAEISDEIDVSRLKFVWKVDVGTGSFIDILNNDKLEEPFLKVALVDKINELSSRMVSKGTRKDYPAMGSGEASLADFERHAYPS